MKNLFICDTPFQIIVCLLYIKDNNLTNNWFLITDKMKNANTYAKNINKLPCIQDACTVKTKHKRYDKLKYFLEEILSYERTFKHFENCIFDNLYVRNYSDLLVNSAFRYFNARNNNLKLIIYDEGYSSYTHEFWNSQKQYSVAHTALYRIMRALGYKFPYDNINKALFFRPDLIFREFPFAKERLLTDDFCLADSDINEFNNIFNYSNPPVKISNKSVIFFEECFSEDYGNNNDLLILNEITKIIDKECIYIKLHPRTTKDRFTSIGYHVLSDMNYPWEVFAMNNSTKDILLISYSSGALVNYLFFTNTKIKSLYLFKAFPGYYQHIQKNEELVNWFDRIEYENKEYIFIPETKQELRAYLKHYFT